MSSSYGEYPAPKATGTPIAGMGRRDNNPQQPEQPDAPPDLGSGYPAQNPGTYEADPEEPEP